MRNSNKAQRCPSCRKRELEKATETYATRKLLILIREAASNGEALSENDVEQLRQNLLEEGAREYERWRDQY